MTNSFGLQQVAGGAGVCGEHMAAYCRRPGARLLSNLPDETLDAHNRWPAALAYADEHMAAYPPDGLAQPNLDTRHLASKVASLVASKIRCAGFRE